MNCGVKFPNLAYQNKSHPLLIAFGNPILDVTIKINSDDIFTKFNLDANQPEERPSEHIEKIKEDALKLSEGKSSINPGGSALNSLRILCLLLQPDYRVMHCGSIGDDSNGKTLLNLLTPSCVDTRYEVIPDQSTANCLCLTHEDSSCLIADIGAAMHYKIDFVTKSLMQDVLNTSFIYVEGFFIPNRYQICEYLLKDICEKNGIVFIMNLSGTYICKNYPNECKTLAESADLVFGNAEQFLELGKAYNFNNLDSVMEHLIKVYKPLKKKCTSFKSKIVIATDASKPVTIFHQQDEKICKMSVEIEKIPSALIKDTTGAGDAFLAGFLYKFLQDNTLRTCSEFGSRVAADIIKRIGVNLTPQFLQMNK
ncbi:adenosine kinase-like [Ctenocephalides felis]|uniref:adenosine kinase-like n=1 Tax=Ctenocephalides felis TaxID=7515 RepID=UPI000E6E21EF|nr:adenosine kinase-like [Ctenocephalides felis]